VSDSSRNIDSNETDFRRSTDLSESPDEQSIWDKQDDDHEQSIIDNYDRDIVKVILIFFSTCPTIYDL